MSIDLLDDVVCVNVETGQEFNHHTVMVGKHCAWCMNCGKILIKYDKTEDFKRLMNPFSDDT